MNDFEQFLPQAGTNELATTFWAAVALSIILPRVPYGRNLLYPFALLGTWAHEFGHGVTSMLAGGSFHKLEIYSNLGGVATYSGVGKKARALVAAGGLLGPAIAGGIVILFGAKEQTAGIALVCLSIVIVASLIFFVRNLFGWVSFALITTALILVSFYAPKDIGILLTQLIGIQFCVASWNTLDYMFTKNFRKDGKTTNSDTQDIAEALLLPYWFWGGLIALLSLGILVGSYYFAWVYNAEL